MAGNTPAGLLPQDCANHVEHPFMRRGTGPVSRAGFLQECTAMQSTQWYRLSRVAQIAAVLLRVCPAEPTTVPRLGAPCSTGALMFK